MQDLVGRARALLGRLRAEVAEAEAAARAAAKATAIESAEEALVQSAVRETACRSPRANGEGASASSLSSSAPTLDGASVSATCVVCLSAPKNTLMLPCRHVATCAECTKAILEGAGAGQPPHCPLCRTRIADTLSVYI